MECKKPEEHARDYKLIEENGQIYFVITEKADEEWLKKSQERLEKLKQHPEKLVLCQTPHAMTREGRSGRYWYQVAPCGSLKDLREKASDMDQIPTYSKRQFTVILIVFYHAAVALDSLLLAKCPHRQLGPGKFLIWKEEDDEKFWGAIGDMATARPVNDEQSHATALSLHEYQAPEVREALEALEGGSNGDRSDHLAAFFGGKREDLLLCDIYSFGWNLWYMFSVVAPKPTSASLTLEKVEGGGLDGLERVLRKIVDCCLKEKEERKITLLEISRMIKMAVETAIARGSKAIDEKLWKASCCPQIFGRDCREWRCTRASLEKLKNDKDFENAWKRLKEMLPE